MPDEESIIRRRRQKSQTELKRYAKNRESIRAKQKAYHEANREKILARKRALRAENLEEFRTRDRERHSANREKRLAGQKAYRQTHPHVMRKKSQLYGSRRRARLRILPNSFTPEQWSRCKQYWGYCCVYCGREEGFMWTLAIDHFIAITAKNTPGNVVTNIIPACDGVDGCNNSKGNKDATVWLTEKLGPRLAAKILRDIHAYFTLVAGG